MQGALTQLRSWKLDHKNEDIRGWALRDPDGHVLGTVGELIVDTDSKHVTQVVLGDGKRYAAHDVLMGDHDLTLAGVSTRAAAAARAEAEAERARRESVEKTAAAQKPASKKEALKETLHEQKEKVKETLRGDKGAPKSTDADKSTLKGADADKGTLKVTDAVIPVVEEEIRVGKRQVDAGGMHVESKVVAVPFDEEVRLRDESVTVERRKVDQPLTLADADARLHEGVVELRATAEETVVEKRARVVEEISLKKDSTEHVEHVRDAVRHTEVDISEIPGNISPKMKKGGVKP